MCQKLYQIIQIQILQWTTFYNLLKDYLASIKSINSSTTLNNQTYFEDQISHCQEYLQFYYINMKQQLQLILNYIQTIQIFVFYKHQIQLYTYNIAKSLRRSSSLIINKQNSFRS
ncbi:unnamed protein product [Paramecium sonneborni]|uniref:Uncharacterized protein n=1 Tax=Paramecium sonneborni TaxID=65129 RepID=A0A8S1KXX9_9CILI|nr:unnamed protein product [Paramecium sonneborni]